MAPRTSDETEAMGRELEGMISRLRELLPKLDTTSTLCAHCGLRHDRNFAERRAASHLEGAIGRLEKVASALAGEEVS